MKLAVLEDGSDIAVEMWSTPRRAASSILSYPEGRAALAAARRGERLTAAGYQQALDDFHSAQSELLLVGVDRELTRRAGELAAVHSLRGYDAVHLATALALGAETTLVAWDERLRRAAYASGCAVAPAL